MKLLLVHRRQSDCTDTSPVPTSQALDQFLACAIFRQTCRPRLTLIDERASDHHGRAVFDAPKKKSMLKHVISKVHRYLIHLLP